MSSCKKIRSPDRRGSTEQRRVFKLVKNLYPSMTVFWEYSPRDTNQRFDIFVYELGIAIEYDGEQHASFNSHLH